METQTDDMYLRVITVQTKSNTWSYAPYPAMVVLHLAFWWYSIVYGFDLAAAIGISLGTSFVAAIVLERLRPLRPGWAMTSKTFFGLDYKYFLVGIPILNVVIPFIATSLSVELVGQNQSHFGRIPLLLETVLSLAAFDFLQYWYHRANHRLPCKNGLVGTIGRRLWLAHSSHHQPEEVYVMMHPIGHPIEMFVVRLGFQVAFFSLAGFSTEAIFMTGCILGFQGIIGHCNTDLRMGPLTHVLTGTETHRCHHSGSSGLSGQQGVE